MVERILDKNMVECSSHSRIIKKVGWVGWKRSSWVRLKLIVFMSSNLIPFEFKLDKLGNSLNNVVSEGIVSFYVKADFR